MTIRTRFLAPVLTTLLLTACGSSSGISGTYTGPKGITSYTFEPGETVEAYSGVRQVAKAHYEVENGKVLIGPKGAPKATFTILRDGSLSTELGMKLTKKD